MKFSAQSRSLSEATDFVLQDIRYYISIYIMRRAKKYKNVRRRYEGTAARAAHKKPDICLKACEKDFVTRWHCL